MPIAIGSGVLYEANTTGSGTGNYNSFLRLAANGQQEGFNTDDGGEADNKDGIWTHSLLVSTLATVDIGGTLYYEIRLDLNEVQSGDKPNITLEDLRIFRSNTPADGDDFDADFSGLTEVFDLGDALDLVDTNHGSGTDDYVFYLPISLFPNMGQYLTLYASFSGSDDGFEEFRVKSNEVTPQPDIGVLKVTNGIDDTCPDVIAGSTVTWTYTVENNGNVPLSDVVLSDDNGTPLDDTDDFNPTAVLVGGFNSGDLNQDNILDTDETWHYSHTGTAIVGEYANIATISGVYDDGSLDGLTVTGVEEDCYNGVTPTIAIAKFTNLTDDTCPYILVGEDVVWTYEVTNTSLGAITIDAIVVTDDAGTPLVAGDDFNPTAVLVGGYNAGDTNTDNLLDVGETWQYTFTAPAIAGEYENIATVNATAHDSSGNTAPVTASGDDCYFGADPSIDIVKMTNGTDDLCPVVSVGDTVTWTYFVENTGNVALENIQIRDDGGSPDPDLTGDFNPTAVLVNGYNVGDIANLGVFDPGEIWQYSATGIALEGHYDNVATVSADFTDDFDHSTTVSDSENDCYVGIEGPGVRTPGFWQNPNNGAQFWDGVTGNEKNLGQDCFPLGELLYAVDKNGDGTIDSTKGLLIGDYDRNGIRNGDEDVIFISFTDAQNLINAKNNQMSDGVVKIGRDLVATWLNYLAGNPVGDVEDDGFYSPREAINDAIDYLQIFGDSSNSNLDTNDTFDCYSAGHKKVDTSSAFWNSDFPGGAQSGAEIHGALDEYNNFGTVNGTGYAHDCESQQFVALMAGYSVHGDMFVM
jgi:hypothetical protein